MLLVICARRSSRVAIGTFLAVYFCYNIYITMTGEISHGDQQAELDLTLLYQSLQHNPDNVDCCDRLRTSDLDDEGPATTPQ